MGAKANKARAGSMQYWPRKRAKKAIPRVRAWTTVSNKPVLGFAGFKVGMTHIQFRESNTQSHLKNQIVSVPVTIIECPPLKVYSVCFYQNTIDGKKIIGEVFADKLDKELQRTLCLPKKPTKKFSDFTTFDDVVLKVSTQPKLTGIGSKKPQIFEVGLSGNKEQKLTLAKEKIGHDLLVTDVFTAGDIIDAHSITKGKGFQGPVKRFGVAIRQHKSEKTKRGPGSLGGWRAQGHVMYRVAHAGQMGYHTRTDLNKLIYKINDKPEEINPSGGFVRYGVVKNPYVLIRGSVSGAVKRLVRLVHAHRPPHRKRKADPIVYLSLASRQGN